MRLDWRAYREETRGTTRVYYDVTHLEGAALSDLPPDVQRKARYIEAVNPITREARVLKDTGGTQGRIARTTEPTH